MGEEVGSDEKKGKKPKENSRYVLELFPNIQN